MATAASEWAKLMGDTSGLGKTNYNDPYASSIAQKLQEYTQAPAYESRYSDLIEGLLSQAANYGSYVSPYAERIDGITQALENASFSYDPSTDPNYQAMRKQYLAEAQRTASDVLGKASAATGGRASSYAVSAASQAANYYKSQLSAQQQALFDSAYQRYLKEFEQRKSIADMLTLQDQTEYGRWADGIDRLLKNATAYQSQEQLSAALYANMLDQLEAQREVLQSQSDSDYSRWITRRDDILNLIASTGYEPYDIELERYGISRAEANRWKQYYLENGGKLGAGSYAGLYSGSGSSGGYYSSGSSGSGSTGTSTSTATSATKAASNAGVIAMANNIVNKAASLGINSQLTGSSGSNIGNASAAVMYTGNKNTSTLSDYEKLKAMQANRL